jgi:hypothetical protein
MRELCLARVFNTRRLISSYCGSGRSGWRTFVEVARCRAHTTWTTTR